MTRRPAAVAVASLLTGLQAVFILLIAWAAAFIFLVVSDLATNHRNFYLARLVLGSIGLLGALVLVGAIMVWSGSRRWAGVIKVFDVLVLALQIGGGVFERLWRIHLSPTSGGVVLGLVTWNLVPLICLLLPSSRRWFDSRPTRGQRTRNPEPLSRQS